jgi:hypothetical protein
MGSFTTCTKKVLTALTCRVEVEFVKLSATGVGRIVIWATLLWAGLLVTVASTFTVVPTGTAEGAVKVVCPLFAV